MKRKLFRWIFRTLLICVVCVVVLISLILNPSIFYSHKTQHNNLTVYHNNKLDSQFITIIDTAYQNLATSEIFNANFKMDICLNDGSSYPKLVELIKGRAFASGFYNKVVIQSNLENSFAILNNYKWNVTELLTHEMVHCLQYNYLGFFKSNPLGNIPNWKWEGYAEYIARQATNKAILNYNNSYINADTATWAIQLPDNSIVPKDYFKNWMLVNHCFENKKLNFDQLLKDSITLDMVEKELAKK